MQVEEGLSLPIAPPSRELFRPFLELAWVVSAVAASFLALSWVLPRLPEPIGSRAALFEEGARTTLELTLASGGLGLLFGMALGIGKLSQNRLWRWPATGLVWALRGTPLLVQILFVYYGLPALSPVLRFSELGAAVLALALNVGAYNAEAVRAGILAVPRGQTEAALSLGLSELQALRWIVLPQALRIMIPPLMNNGVSLLKDSALASSIGLLELTLAGNRISSETFLPVPPLLTVAAVYLLLTSLISFVVLLFERRLR